MLSGAASGETFASDITGWASAHRLGTMLKLMEHSYVNNPMVEAIMRQLSVKPRRVVWAGDYADAEKNDENLSDMTEHLGSLKIGPPMSPVPPVNAHYLLDLDRSEYVDLTALPSDVHPLPLLTADGNGRGGGDYHGPGMEFIGRWARDLLSVPGSDWTPTTEWTEIKPDFIYD